MNKINRLCNAVTIFFYVIRWKQNSDLKNSVFASEGEGRIKVIRYIRKFDGGNLVTVSYYHFITFLLCHF